MPLIAKCEKCGQEVILKNLDEWERFFIFIYDCPNCKMTFQEHINKQGQ
jgi:ssDNA-binding Zn-finger/Zn-ribbon topoisomerase 1